MFYDRNATRGYSVAYTDLGQLDAIAWDLFFEAPLVGDFAKYWHDRPAVERHVDRMEKRQAEFLVRDRMAIRCTTRVGVIDDAKANEVRAALAEHGVNLPVQVMRDWYFLPGQ